MLHVNIDLPAFLNSRWFSGFSKISDHLEINHVRVSDFQIQPQQVAIKL